ncbi:methyltransferase [Streptomyces caniferus]|uniref:methyltransferase n=1 Tax=Streptomyces caniferus TaxID=285557 RepID=UPI0033E6375C
MTSMSTVMGVTAVLLQQLDLRPGQRMLDIGTGAGVTAATACHVCGDAGVVTLDRDPYVVAAARGRLAVLGLRAHGGGSWQLPTPRTTEAATRPGKTKPR